MVYASVLIWVGPNGERPLLPQDEGQGVMLSAFSFHEFGFGFNVLTNKELAIVNDKCDGTFYSDTDAVGFEKGGKKMPLHANVSSFSLLEYMAATTFFVVARCR